MGVIFKQRYTCIEREVMNMLRHPITKKDEEDEEGSEGRRRKVEKNAQLNKVK